MNRRSIAAATTAAVLLSGLLACGGLFSGSGEGMSEEVADELDQIQPTVLQAGATLPPILIEGAGTPPGDQGDGVQVYSVAPLGPGHTPLQVAVVFDRQMVTLGSLDEMAAKVPIACTPEVPGKARWAGTTTAVYLPDAGEFPNATEFSCTVAKGTGALDGASLEKDVTWTFETPRPQVTSVDPRDGHRAWSPDQPLSLTFDQDVDAAKVGGFVTLTTDAGIRVATTVEQGDSPKTVVVRGSLAANQGYRLSVRAGFTGSEGPLPSSRAHVSTFRTYPPLQIVKSGPSGTVDPYSSIALEFTTGVKSSEVSKHLTITPKPSRWSPPEGDWASRWYGYWASLSPRTTYTVALSPGVEDEYGQKLASGTSWTFETGDYQPWVHVGTGMQVYAANNPAKLPLRHLNTGSLFAKVARVDPAALLAAGDWDDIAAAALASAPVTEVEVTAAPNTIELDEIDFSSALKGGRGLVAAEVWSPAVTLGKSGVRRHRSLLVVTDLGATLKVGPGEMTAWVTTLSDGKPVEGATVEYHIGKRLVGTAKTDADGVAVHKGAPDKTWKRYRDDAWLLVKKGSDVGYVDDDWDDGISPWNFGEYVSFDADGSRVQAHAFADRGVYRLGDPVYARATFRVLSAKGLEQPGAATVEWSMSGPDGEEGPKGTGSLDDRGGISVQTALPKDGRLGDWYLSIRAKGAEWDQSAGVSVPARAYRAPSFRVETHGPEVAVAGDELEAHAEARYLFGSPLGSGAKATWRAWYSPSWFRPEGWDGYSFGPEYNWWDDDDSPGTTTLSDDTTELVDGKATYTAKVEKGASKRPVNLHMEAEVMDVDRQTVASSVEVMVHPAAYYVGLRAGSRLPEAGRETFVEVVAVAPDGTGTTGGEAAISVVRRTWDRVREKDMDGRWHYVSKPKDEPVHDAAVTAGAKPQKVAFTPDKAGYYVVTANATDGDGRSIEAVESFYVSGSGYTSWAFGDDNHLELVPEKQKYKPGETAKILVKTPKEGLRALVTVEREGILWRDVVTLKGTADVVEVPIEAAWRPNLWVSVVAVEGAPPQTSPDKGRPQVYVGLQSLQVDAEEEHLAVSLQTDLDTYRPRDTVNVTVQVDRAGAGVGGAGVTLYAVDEAVLQLTAYQTPDPFDAFYVHHGLSVLTSDSRVRALDRAPFLTKGATSGGGGGMEDSDGPSVRRKFVTTVTWQDLKTGPDGKVTAKFTLPDNLTAFRIMAVADAGATGFGSTDKEIQVTRPLIARPALPRLLRSGDVAFAGMVVHNNTDSAMSVDVTGKVEGAAVLTGSPVTVSVAAHDATEVAFRVEGKEPGEAKFLFSVSSGKEKDAVEWIIPVRRELSFDVVATSGTLTSDHTEKIAPPTGARPGFGGLEIDVASTALVGAGAGLDYLVEYPHGCVEQITSKGTGALVALEVRDHAGITLDEAALRDNVVGVLADLGHYRHWSGGFGYWKGSRWATPMGTAYAVDFMGRAREAGYEIDETLLADAAQYLRERLNERKLVGSWDPILSLQARAYIAVALSRAGLGDAGHNSRLYAQVGDLTMFGASSLMEAIARTTGPDARTATIERLLQSRMTVDATTAQIKENGTDQWARIWGSDDLATAAALEALLVAKGEHVLAPKIARHLVDARKSGRWANTRATAGVLAALAEYAHRYEKGTGDVRAVVQLGGKELLSEAIPVPGTAKTKVSLADLKAGDLTFTASGGRLYFEERLKWAPINVEPRDEGFTLVREVEILEGGEGGKVTAGALLAINLRVVTPVTRYDVAVVDPFPAGLEPVDSSFATTSNAPMGAPEGKAELPEFGGSWVFDHSEIADDQVRLYADYMPAGVHSYRYVARATTPGTFEHPAATVEAMYRPEIYGRTAAGAFSIGRAAVKAPEAAPAEAAP